MTDYEIEREIRNREIAGDYDGAARVYQAVLAASDTGWNRDVRHHLRERDYGWYGSQVRVQRDSDGQLVAWSNLGRHQWRDNGGGPGEGHSESGFAANH
jgi:hypothetical protein